MPRSNATDLFTTELTVEMGPTDLTATVLSTAGSAASPCYMVIDPNTTPNNAEIVYFDGTFTGTSFVTTSLANRYLSNSAASSGLTHAVGAKVIFSALGIHHDEVHDEIDAHEAASAVHGAVSTATANTIPLRDASARFRAADPSNVADVATKGYADTHAALTNPHSATNLNTASRLVLRDASGRAEFTSPISSLQAANKGYVDGKTGVAVYERSSSQTIATDSEVTWTANTEVSDTLGASVSSGVVTVANAGLYVVQAHIVWAGSSNGGFRRAWILVNNDPVTNDTQWSSANINFNNDITSLLSLSAGQNVRVNVRQSSGASVSVNGAGSGSFTSQLTLMRIA